MKRASLEGVARVWRGALASLRASAWCAPVARVLAAAVGLTFLAFLGRAAGAVPHAEHAMHAPAPRADASAEVPAPAPVAPETPAPCVSAATPSTRAATGEPVDINTATAEELQRLPGVGAKRAEAILSLRAKLGRFRRVEDLLRVRGVGRSTLKRWRPLLRASAPASPEPR